MKKINLDEVYFHGIRPPSNVENAQLKILESILQHRAILPRKKQQELGIKSILNDNLNRNGAERVSICSSRSDAFSNWVRDKISIILTKEIPDCDFVDTRDFNGIDGELQIKGAIPAKYFIGIGIPTFGKSFSQTVRVLQLGANYHSDSEKYFKKWMKDYCKDEITPVREILRKCGCNLELYDIETGELIPTIEELCNKLYHNNQELTL